MTDWDGEFIAVDWGTTNRRAYLVDASGAVRAQIEDDCGVTAVPERRFESAVGTIVEQLGNRPLLMAGMIGSNRGWREAPYAPCPAGLAEVAAALLWVSDRRVAIVPGLSFRDGAVADVMRGEEVQIFGLMRMLTAGPERLTVCHPGTHTKWARVEGGRIARFRTAMTGELFDLLREHSLLAPMLRGEVEVGDAFRDGVRRGRADGTLSADLFAIRAKVLLSEIEERHAASLASGLLIGCDLRAGLAEQPKGAVIVLGRPSLTRLYAAALQSEGIETREVDGAEAFVAGMHAIRDTIR